MVGASRIRRGPARRGGVRDGIPMGRPEGESDPERESAKGRPVSPMSRPEGESGPERAARRVVK